MSSNSSNCSPNNGNTRSTRATRASNRQQQIKAAAAASAQESQRRQDLANQWSDHYATNPLSESEVQRLEAENTGTLANNSAMRAVLVDGTWHMIQQTTRAVAAREELRHDYGPGFDQNRPWIGREPIAAN